jgi:hypothetical protein
MSLVALKRKTAAMQNLSTGQKGFSINGTHRSQGYIGQTSLSRSLINTPHGQTGAPEGYGGCCGDFSTTTNIRASETFSLEDENVVKKSVLSNTGMLSNRNRWLKRSAPYTSTKLTSGWTNAQGDYIAYLKKKAARGCDTIQTETFENYIDTYYIITDVAGNGIAGDNGSENWSSITRIPYPRDPLDAQLNAPSSVTVFNDQDTEIGATLYICDTGNFFIKMIEVDRDGKLTDFAGKRASSTGVPLQGSVPGPLDKLSMRLNIPTYVTTDINGNVYIADAMNQMIYKIARIDYQMDYVAGNGDMNAGADYIAARSSALNKPRAVLVDDQLNIYIADSGNNKIRFVDYETDVITTIINSSGVPGYQDGRADEALLRDPRDMIFDSNGNLYFVDFGNKCIRFYNKTTNNVSTFLKREDLIGNPTSITINPKNNDLFIADSVANKIFLVKNINGVQSITSIESLLGGNYTNNSMMAYNSLLYYPLKNPNCVFFDSKTDQLLIADTGNNKIRSFEIYNEYITKTTNKCTTTNITRKDGAPVFNKTTVCTFTKPVSDYTSLSQGEHIFKLHDKCADQDDVVFSIVSNTRRSPLIGS